MTRAFICRPRPPAAYDGSSCPLSRPDIFFSGYGWSTWLKRWPAKLTTFWALITFLVFFSRRNGPLIHFWCRNRVANLRTLTFNWRVVYKYKKMEIEPNASSDQFQPKRLLIDLFMSYLLVYSLIKLVHFWGKKFTKTVGSMRKQPVDGAAVVRDAGGLTVACGEPSLGLPWRRRASQVGIV